jgi:hypothetical protein
VGIVIELVYSLVLVAALLAGGWSAAYGVYRLYVGSR